MRRAVWCLLVAACLLSSAGWAGAPAAKLPGEIVKVIEGLKVAFDQEPAGRRAVAAVPGRPESREPLGESYHFIAWEKGQRKELDRLFSYARRDRASATALADYLLADMNRFSSRFGPGATIDERLLGRPIVGRFPWYGVEVDGCLLLTLAQERQDAGFTRRVLTAVLEAEQAERNFNREGAIRRTPKTRHREKELQEARFEEGAFSGPTTWGLSWCCERFLTRLDQAKGRGLPPAAKKVVADYARWRWQALANMKQSRWPADPPYETLKYARPLAEALPGK